MERLNIPPMVAVKLLANLGLDGKAEKEEIEKLLGAGFLKEARSGRNGC